MITFILTYMGADKYRQKNIDFVIKKIQSLPIVKQILVVEQGMERTYFNEFIDIIFVKKPGLFHKSLLYNIGVKYSKYDLLFFHDIDLFMNQKSYLKSIEDLKDYDVVDPYLTIMYFDENSSKGIMKGLRKSGKRPYKILTSGVISGGCFLMKKEKFNEIGGFDERCIGYGYEDDVFDIKMKLNKLNIKRNKEYYCVHLYHPCQKNEKRNFPIYVEYYKKLKDYEKNITGDSISQSK